MKKTVRIVCLALVAALAASALFSCAGLKNKKVVMRLGSYDVTYDVYRFAVLTEKAAMKIKYGDGVFDGERDDRIEDELRERTVSYLRGLYAIPALAADYGIKADDEAIRILTREKKKDDVASVGGEDAFLEELGNNNMTEDVYDLMASYLVMSDETFSAMMREGDIDTDPGHVREYLAGDGCIRILEVLISKEKHTDEEAKKIALEVRDAALSAADPAGGDFYDLVMEYGENIDMFNNPDGYYMMRGVWNRDFEDAAFSLDVGEISEVIETPRGFSVLIRLEKSEEYIDRRIDSLTEDYYDSVFALAKEKKGGELEMKTEKVYDKIDIWKLK